MKKKIIYIFLILIALAGVIGVYAYSVFNTGFNIDKTIYVYIDEKEDYNNLLQQIKDSAKVENISHFEQLASVLGYKDNLKSGRYAIKPGMNIYDAIINLRRGDQSPVKLTFNNIRTKEDFARRISEQVMFSEDDLLKELDDESKANAFGFNSENIRAMFIPNTYEFYWNTTVDNFLQRMKKEHERFWNDNRLAKAKQIGLTPVEVSTLASIVEEECMYADEYPAVAGLYINRLNRGQALQADPTIKYALGDFSLRRILNKYLEVESPYNTYKHTGLPPGPIRIPSIKGIDAVLDYKKHDYYYMCAKEDFSGYHNFAKTHAEHERNANRYWQALNARKIYK